VESAVGAALAVQFGVSPSSTAVRAEAAPAARLLGEARRLAAMTWLVTYQVLLSSPLSVASATASSVTPSSFVSSVGANLIALGIDSSLVSRSLVLISFEPFSVSRVVVDSALRPSCEHGSILAMLGTEETLLVCQGCSSGVEHSTATRWTYLCSLEYFGNVPQPRVSAGSTSIEVPVDHPLGNFTHLAIFTKSVVASVSSVAFPDEDLDAAEIGGKIRWVATAAKSERVL
ncbi:unnamed protein product, partial [Symbiodinium sp. KB8]